MRTILASKKFIVSFVLTLFLGILFIPILIILLFNKSDNVVISGLENGMIINLEKNNPTLKFDGEFQVMINGKQIYKGRNEYKFNNEDLVEGENIVEVSATSKKLFSRGAEPVKYNIFVDRTAPIFSAEQISKNFLLFEDFTFSVNAETGASVYVNSTKIGEITEENQVFSSTPINGNNKIEIYAMDTNGNKSESTTFSFNAFYKQGWETISCGGVKLVMDTQTMQRGYSSINNPFPDFSFSLSELNMEKCGVSEKYIYLAVHPKGAVAECSVTECGGDIIYLLYSDHKPYNGGKIDSNWERILTIEEYTTLSGVKGVLRQTYGGTNEGDYSTFSFIFPVNGESYSLGIVVDGEKNFTDIEKQQLLEIIDAIVIE